MVGIAVAIPMSRSGVDIVGRTESDLVPLTPQAALRLLLDRAPEGVETSDYSGYGLSTAGDGQPPYDLIAAELTIRKYNQEARLELFVWEGNGPVPQVCPKVRLRTVRTDGLRITVVERHAAREVNGKPFKAETPITFTAFHEMVGDSSWQLKVPRDVGGTLQARGAARAHHRGAVARLATSQAQRAAR